MIETTKRWEIKHESGLTEPLTAVELRDRCVAGAVVPDTPVRQVGVTRWGWAIDVPGLSNVYALPKVHWMIPAFLIPVGVAMIGLSFAVDASPMGSHPKGGAETVAFLLFLGAVAAGVGILVPLLEYLIRRLAVARLPDPG